MKVELIEVGKTYVGRKGTRRTVVSKDVSLSGKPSRGNVVYHTGDANVLRACWRYTFADWAQRSTEDIAVPNRAVTMRNAAPELYAELEHLVKLMEPYEQTCGTGIAGLATLNGARAALARAGRGVL